MSTKHYVDDNGKYLGGFGDGAIPPSGAVEVTAPQNGKATWTGSEWIMPVVSDAEIDALTDAKGSKGEQADRELLYQLLKSKTPTLTPEQFRAQRRAIIATLGD